VVVPGQVLTKEATIEAIGLSPGWDSFSIADARVVRLTPDSAVLTYRFSGRRGGDPAYDALMGSAYVKREGSWKMAFHQQTPLG
jgi:hypothetical protein